MSLFIKCISLYERSTIIGKCTYFIGIDNTNLNKNKIVIHIWCNKYVLSFMHALVKYYYTY